VNWIYVIKTLYPHKAKFFASAPPLFRACVIELVQVFEGRFVVFSQGSIRSDSF